ncbi:carbohydrate ABC transporter permease [Xylanimonas protaetiae]|uniref:Carbohydrate ABC transporter permease n=1 Tax=Xylanimonas protaetiae TaxID=2509457 RepID=A0A4V0YGC8_9MICO|nr:carbohydrate ABC transporter permease [Xylanimonas protaetiae]QAY70761.1 carbohydrate ABC transporter permease [Xylanimonas protaetiae]
MKKRLTPGGVLLTFATVVLAVTFLVPVLWSLAVSLHHEGQTMSNVFDWFLPPYTLENYPTVLLRSGVWVWFVNSLIIAIVSTALTLLVTPMAAYAVARIKFKGATFFYIFMILGLMVPGEATITSLFVTANWMHLINTYAGLILPGIAASMNFIIITAFIKQLPNELTEAATVDGAGHWRIYWSLVLPLSKTILLTVGILTFTGSWNNYLWPLLATMTADMFTLPIGIPTFASTYTVDYVLPMTANMVASLPMIVLFVIFQRYIVKGVSLTGIKG